MGPLFQKRNTDDSMSRPCTKRSKLETSSSNSIIKEIKRLYGRVCMHCEGTIVYAAHVFAPADDNFDDYKAANLVNLASQGDAENFINLCPNCHKAYDRPWKPRLLIVPKYLEFFTQAEKKAQVRAKGHRIPPNAITYAEYCQRYDETLDPDKGGQYMCYMDVAFLGPYGVQPGRNLVRQWAGDPMAMLYRAMSAACLIMKPRGFPRHVQDELRALQALYMDGNGKFARSVAVTHDEGIEASPPTPLHTPLPSPSNTRSPGLSHPPAGPPPQAASPSTNVDAHTNAHTATGMLSPLPTLTALPDSAELRKRKYTEASINANTGDASTQFPKRARLEAPPVKSLPVEASPVEASPGGNPTPDEKPAGYKHVWKLFLQSSHLPDPNETPPDGDIFSADIASTANVADDTAPPPNPYDPFMDDKRFWRWEGRTAQAAIDYWQAVFVPLYAPKSLADTKFPNVQAVHMTDATTRH
ncbi:hypothetical protein P153DRAFT_147172 [Dothidotthia symphoricarpi CBS 119687]|uniref:HNH nuclease domain-containing protein n=1 Tax=Dothidotthia symphoricarpi CBS 119687 TaxID=1392245 RepID=A0A6A5ZXB3_9PLEO|nr:uncharacterized protein P153DRAFT_147172 [Dothidotthia symphoricarpi CBS 119687]KAF2123665.1 hypothetical protein P153DRAFT_147172 [Dothidotthia symphoricarpi CBS 119687]